MSIVDDPKGYPNITIVHTSIAYRHREIWIHSHRKNSIVHHHTFTASLQRCFAAAVRKKRILTKGLFDLCSSTGVHLKPNLLSNTSFDKRIVYDVYAALECCSIIIMITIIYLENSYWSCLDGLEQQSTDDKNYHYLHRSVFPIWHTILFTLRLFKYNTWSWIEFL